MSIPTAEEKLVIEKFRERVGDILKPEQLKDDWFLIRWLRARDLNLDKSETMLRNSMAWRAQGNVDKTLELPVDAYFLQNYPFNVSGRDREGRAVLILPLGKWDARLAIQEGKFEHLVTHINFFFESVMKAIKDASQEANRPADHPLTQFTAIVDWDGYSFGQFKNLKAAQTVLRMSSVYEAHYPEILAHCIFYNTTKVFQLLWKLMKQVLAEKTVGKIQVYGTNRKEWEPAILKLVDPAKLKYELREGMNLSEEEVKKIEEIQEKDSPTLA